MKKKAFFIIFKGFSFVKKCLRPESELLKTDENVYINIAWNYTKTILLILSKRRLLIFQFCEYSIMYRNSVIYGNSIMYGNSII